MSEDKLIPNAIELGEFSGEFSAMLTVVVGKQFHDFDFGRLFEWMQSTGHEIVLPVSDDV